MLIGAHVRAGKGIVPALEHGDEIGADAVQIFTQSPRAWKPTQYGPDVLAGYRQAEAAHPRIEATFCHATYLINLATPDPELRERSRQCLAANLAVAEGIGARGLILHIGSHRGAGMEAMLAEVVDGLLGALDGIGGDCPILLENAAGAGDTVGRTLDELSAVISAAGEHPRLGICIDTQHLWASGIDFSTVEGTDAVIGTIDATVGLDRLGALHLNDSKVELGANRDRHENLGEGTIGPVGLAAFLGHPALDGLAALLEVPGSGDGPRAEDVTAARALLHQGRALRA